jgi:Fic family protein
LGNAHPNDWINALKLGNEVYLQHSKSEVLKFKSNTTGRWTKGTNSIEYLINKDALTDIFTTAYAIQMNEKYTGVSDRTTSFHLKEALRKGIIEKVAEGKYKIAA